MRIVLQRVTRAAVRVSDKPVGEIGPGLVAFVGIAEGDSAETARRLAQKTAEMRLFSDEAGRFSLSVLDLSREVLVISQFTLYGDVRRGRRPDFTAAARPEVAEPLVEEYAKGLEAAGVRVARGRFGAKMAVDVLNDGPVTIILDSSDLERPRRG